MTSTLADGAAVVTGIGIAAPTGLGTSAYWAATLAGESGIRPITRFDATRYPVRVGGEVDGFVAEQHVPSRLLPQTDHSTRLSLAAGAEALAASGLTAQDAPEFGIGIATASSMGGFEFGQRELGHLWALGAQHVSAYQSFAWFYAVNTGQLSIRHGLRGPGTTVVSDQAGGLDALGAARRQIRKGTAAVLAGGVDSALCPLGLAGQLSTGELAASDDPRGAYLPFDRAAAGHVPGEGGAFLILEDPAFAQARGATVHGEIAGYASTFDLFPDGPDADGLLRAARQALADAGLAPFDIDVVFGDASGRPDADRAEAAVLVALFGPNGVPVTAPKSATGRLCAGAGALDVATALLSLRDGVIPPTVHVREVDPGHQIDLVVGEPRRPTGRLRTALVLARGHGGFNAALVVRGPATTAAAPPTSPANPGPSRP
ncbi:ketosynthase chain-length factor [Frankia sp. R82]|uniref:ketosynthase chain-length factor n=1 Tax=Frankia sp. R82 TaxID=2950553 RepID=UPI0020445097|nr:ketosynthase chain-length factor [Frankia sp. R82]MCM3882384.1 ketosynthase chain-length factor [Frankia sp. R82]